MSADTYRSLLTQLDAWFAAGRRAAGGVALPRRVYRLLPRARSISLSPTRS